MSDVGINLKNLAKQIAQRLDKLDGNTDNFISSHAWNNIFGAKSKGGNEIRTKISVFNAEKSINNYLQKASNSKNERANIGLNWFNALIEQTDENTEEIDAKKEIPKKQNFADSNNSVLSPIIERAVSTAVYKVPENIIAGDFSASKRTALALTKETDYVNKIHSIESLIKKEIAKKGINESSIDISYWAERIARVSSEFDIPKEVMVSIISKETGFKKNVSNKNGKGAMALTGIAIRSFFPIGRGNWNDIYQQLNNDLLQDILYKKDSSGNMIKDSKGKPILKYKSSQELLMACGKDDELSMKVGSLIFEMKYAEAVATKKYGRATYANIPKVIRQLKNGEITLTESENKTCVGQAVKNYNGCNTMIRRNGKLIAIKDDYRRDVMDSLKVQGFNFAEQNIIKHS